MSERVCVRERGREEGREGGREREREREERSELREREVKLHCIHGLAN